MCTGPGCRTVLRGAVSERKVTVVGDSSKLNWRDLSVILSGKRAVLPVDGREWEDLQMRKQNVDFVRDSILRERVQRVKM